MDTLRGFVATMTHGEGADGKDLKFYNKPDTVSGNLYELRRLTTSSSDPDSRVKTDFYEYYWAYNIRDTKAQQVIKWVLGIIFRWPGSLPKRIRPFHIMMWVFLLASIAMFVTGVKLPFSDRDHPIWIGAIGTLISGYLGFLLTQYVGDAARYTSANPGNIKERQKIRHEGIALLKSLCESNRYEKVILVGHSLGSIIGYDLIKHLWADYHAKYADTKFPADLLEFEKKYAKPGCDIDIKTFRQDQETMFYHQSKDGNPWKISHFVTLGSPLTHASFLLAKDLEELKERMAERELPMSPPVSEVVSGKERITYQPDFKKPQRVLHHGAPFACTQWVNVYYKNDFVGGDLAGYFGKGVDERPITLKGNFLQRWIPFLSHTHYWSGDRKDFRKCEEAAKILKEIIWK